jgi:HEAT repeat protein
VPVVVISAVNTFRMMNPVVSRPTVPKWKPAAVIPRPFVPPPAVPIPPQVEIPEAQRRADAEATTRQLRAEFQRDGWNPTIGERLGELGAYAQEAVPDLILLTISPQLLTRNGSLDALKKIQPGWKTAKQIDPVYPMILQQIKSGQYHAPSTVELILEVDPRGTRAIPVLVGNLGAEEGDLRTIALHTLNRVNRNWQGSPEVSNTLKAWVGPESQWTTLPRELKRIFDQSGPGIIPALMDHLGDGDNPQAERALAYFGKPPLPVLGACLQSESPSRRRGAARTLQQYGEDASVMIPLLIDGLQAADSQTRAVFCATLFTINKNWHQEPDAQGILFRAIAKMNDPDDSRRSDALRLLGYFGPGAFPAIPGLIAHLGTGKVTCTLAGEALYQIDPTWLKRPEAAKTLQDLIRRFAAGPSAKEPFLKEAIKQFDPILPSVKETIPQLIQGADRRDVQRKVELILLLNRIEQGWTKRPEAQGMVETFNQQVAYQGMTNTRLGEVVCSLELTEATLPGYVRLLGNSLLRNKVEQQLRAWDRNWAKQPGVQTAVRDLVDLLKEEIPSTRQNGLLAIKEIGPPAALAVPWIQDCLRDRSLPVRLSAASSLAGIGPAARSAIPEVRRAIAAEQDPQIREIIQAALKKIEQPELIQEAPNEIGQSVSPQ